MATSPPKYVTSESTGPLGWFFIQAFKIFSICLLILQPVVVAGILIIIAMSAYGEFMYFAVTSAFRLPPSTMGAIKGSKWTSRVEKLLWFLWKFYILVGANQSLKVHLHFYGVPMGAPSSFVTNVLYLVVVFWFYDYLKNLVIQKARDAVTWFTVEAAIQFAAIEVARKKRTTVDAVTADMRSHMEKTKQTVSVGVADSLGPAPKVVVTPVESPPAASTSTQAEDPILA